MDIEDLEIDIIGYGIELRIIVDSYKKILNTLEVEEYPQVNKNIITHLKYRMLVTNILMLISTWEQQIFSFIYKFNSELNNAYNDIRSEYIRVFKVDESLFNSLSEYRKLVGVFKHGKSGDSFKTLVKKQSKFVNETNLYENLKNSISFNLPILNIEEKDIEIIGQKLENFWKEIIKILKNEYH